MSDRTRKIWLARDRDGEIFAFESKPILDGDVDSDGSIWDDNTGTCVELGWEQDLKEVTFENSPVKATSECWHDDLKSEDITIINWE